MRIRQLLTFIPTLFLLAAGTACTFDVSGLDENQVEKCGNGILDPGEVCDGLEFLTSCEQLGYLGGNLACQLDCTLDDTGCIDGCGECLPPSSRCLDDAVYTCVMRNDGCGYYSPEVDCGIIRQWCVQTGEDAACSATCSSQCELGQRACSPDGTSLEGCVEVMDGETELCRVWNTLRRCGEDGCVEEPEPLCADPCEDACEADTEMCSVDRLHRLRCMPGFAGCLDWIEIMPSCIPGSEVCEMAENDQAICSCRVCEADTKLCSADGTDVLYCTENGNTCTRWTTQFDCDALSPFLRCSPPEGFVCALAGNTCATALPINPSPRQDASTNEFATYFTNAETFTDISCGPSLLGAGDAFIILHLPAGGTIRAAQESTTGPKLRFRIQAADACGGAYACLAQADQELLYSSFVEQDVIISVELDPTSVHTSNDVDVVIERLPNDCTDVESEVNNVPAEADVLSAQPQEIWGFCSRLKAPDPFSTDVDCFSFTVPAPGRRFELGVTSLLDPDTCISDAQLRLYKPDGSLVATSATESQPPCTRIAAEETGMESLIALPPATYRACVSRQPLMPDVDLVSRVRFYPAPSTPVATSFFTCPATGWSTRSESSGTPGATWQCNTTGSRFMNVTVVDPESGRYFLMSPVADLSLFSHAILSFEHQFTSSALGVTARVFASTDDFSTSMIELAGYTVNTSGRQTMFVPAHQLAGLSQVKIGFILDLQTSFMGATTTWEVDEVTLYAY